MAEEKTSIFRKKPLDEISSPEQLNDYLRVTTPGVWAVLAAVIVMLIGLFAWSMSGNLETVAEGVAVVEDGKARITVIGSDRNKLAEDMTVRFESDEFCISDVEKSGKAYADVTLEDGTYDVKIVIESIHPIKFLFS